uniref:Uncharacterized protein n=1 Tax=Physcomitrium patens TaxID=3218 RepID=A0A7I3Z1J4_PHYPA
MRETIFQNTKNGFEGYCVSISVFHCLFLNGFGPETSFRRCPDSFIEWLSELITRSPYRHYLDEVSR